ncbi:MAG: RidA family protein [Alphaproteobacteria bacterium]|nr:RidA family protein [Alphaproteobacteria bacterium]
MAGQVEKRLAAAGIQLPPAPAPAGNYVPVVITGKLAFVAGQVALKDGKVAVKGRLGAEVTIEQGREAAKICAVNILTQLKAAIGDLDRVRRCVRLAGFVNCTAEFTDQPEVMNGASDLMVLAFGDAGKHARAAVGAPSLPRGTAVEVEAVFEIE